MIRAAAEEARADELDPNAALDLLSATITELLAAPRT